MKFIFAERHFGLADPSIGKTYNSLSKLFNKILMYWVEHKHRKKERFDDYMVEINRGYEIGFEEFIKENDFFDVFTDSPLFKTRIRLMSPEELWDLLVKARDSRIRKEITKAKLSV